MTESTARVGTAAWQDRTGGRLTGAERRALLPALARTHLVNAAGRTAMLLGIHPGRRAHIPPQELRMPSSVLTRAATEQARQRLSPELLNHSYRSYLFGIAVGALEHLDVDRELLFAAAMLHDTGLSGEVEVEDVDFTVASARLASDVARGVGLSTAATQTLRTAITLHHTPGVTPVDGPVAYLLSAGAALDVVGVRAWQLPRAVLDSVVAQHPRLEFKRTFTAALAAEAAAVPSGRVRLLRRYGAFDLAIRLAPFPS